MSNAEEETLGAKADRLAREAIKREMDKHRPGPGPVSKQFCRMDVYEWPCPTVRNFDEALEAIHEAEEEEERIANGPYHCNRLIYSATLTDPEEHCDEEVSAEGELCAKHEAVDYDESDRDDREYEARRDARYDD